MSHSLLGADRRTHLRIVGVSLAAVAVLAVALVAAGLREPDSNALVANAPSVIKAEKETTWTSRKTTGAVQ
jgi:hypothetical protein